METVGSNCNAKLKANMNMAIIGGGILAVRFEHQTGFQKKLSIIPYGVVHFPGTSYTVRLSIEQSIQEGNNQTLVEAGVMF